MNNRLKTILNLVSGNTGVIDVGTDHGYIPIALAETGYTGNLYASDINRGPLNSAIQNAAERGVGERIVFLLSDGLKACPYDKIDTVIIAGMGGDLIVRILDAAPWCINPFYKLILQPMSRQEVLRSWLNSKGFSMQSYVSPEKQRYYQIISAQYSGKTENYNSAELITGFLRDVADYPFFEEYIGFHLKTTEEELIGQLNSKTPDEAAIKRLTEIKSQLLSMKESVQNDQ